MCPQCLRYFVIVKPGAFYNEVNVSRDCPIRAQAASPGICRECNRSNHAIERWKCEGLGGENAAQQAEEQNDESLS